MEEIKSKFLDLINKQNRTVKIPSMGFSDYYMQNNSSCPFESAEAKTDVSNTNSSQHQQQSTYGDHRRLPDQEILDGIEEVYYQEEFNAGEYELQKFNETTLDYGTVEHEMMILKQQHKVVSKKVLQNILDQQTPCNDELTQITQTEIMLAESLTMCKQARLNLATAKQNLATSSLEILATYKKRETLKDLLKTLQTMKKLKSTESRLQELLMADNYSGAIEILLECKAMAMANMQFKCIEALTQKLQDTMMLTELQLDNVLNEMTQCFDTKKYSQLQQAYRLLGKTLIAIDQLHMNFISAIHTTAFTVLKNHIEQSNDEKQIFEQMCQNVTADKYIPCLLNLCKCFWSILVCYYQVTMWHQNDQNSSLTNIVQISPLSSISQIIEQEPKMAETNEITTTLRSTTPNDDYIQQKFRNGQSRIWNDIQSKICTYLSSTKLHNLKYEHFIQILSIVQRLKKVGVEFCGEPCTNLLDSVREQSIAFFQRYHATSLEEICLFLDNEAWMPVNSFNSFVQLQEFRFLKKSSHRHLLPDTVADMRSTVNTIPLITNDCIGHKTINHDNGEDSISYHSQDGGSSIYGSCGYFYRFAEKSSPFDGGFDEAMLEEDILAGIADESSCYFSEESEEERCIDSSNSSNGKTRLKQLTCNDDVTNCEHSPTTSIIVSNSSLNVLRCIGRYLQMCRLLHSIAPHIVASMSELIDFYIYAVHDLFGSDLPVPRENLYTSNLTVHLNRISQNVIPKLRHWPPSFSMIHTDLCNPETMYGFQQRIIGVESAISLVNQYEQLLGYLEHLLTASDRKPLREYIRATQLYVVDLRKPVYMCVTARLVDLQTVLTAMTKVKWDINHVNVEQSPYVTLLNRGVQTFAMRLEGLASIVQLPKEAIWDNLAHVLTHTLVEGYASAKKCTPGGRALMQLDFAHFMSILDLTSTIKHPVHHQYVDNYIKAYYMPKDHLEQWIKEQKQSNCYSNKQLTTLIQCTCVNDKKTKQKLLSFIESSSDSTP